MLFRSIVERCENKINYIERNNFCCTNNMFLPIWKIVLTASRNACTTDPVNSFLCWVALGGKNMSQRKTTSGKWKFLIFQKITLSHDIQKKGS